MRDEAKVIKDSKKETPERRLLTHRVHFVSLQQEAEDSAPRIARALQVSNVNAVAEMLQWFGSTLLRRASWAMHTATQKAIDEAVSLIQDPDYYQTVRERRRRERAREEVRRQEGWERRKNPPRPTLDEVQRKIKWTRDDIARNTEWVAKGTERLAELEKVEAELLAEVDSKEIVM